ncbi:AhpA/YtjB family protein [Shewanella surugensis]|uniref:Virulence factor, hemolysin regulator n=1 Tax=Shewanella surugensis TaxID=212020 RepID=A0ABT0LAG0_9GAMM|nr:AhpA/YtjB family protein [Shewanella surugensis]MCL1124696.1 hypothetical protein [Shewanella surugensis]
MFFLKGLKKSHRISRLIQIIIAVLLMIGLFQLWETSLLQGQQLLKSQTKNMARLFIQQTAYAAAPALKLKDQQQLSWLANGLIQDPKVMSASIFNHEGVRLAFAQKVTDKPFEPNSETLTRLLNTYPPFVEPVLQDGENLGYIELRLTPNSFLNDIKAAHELNMQQQQIMLLIAGIIGMLLSRSLSYKRVYVDRRKARIKLIKRLRKQTNANKGEKGEKGEKGSDSNEHITQDKS